MVKRTRRASGVKTVRRRSQYKRSQYKRSQYKRSQYKRKYRSLKGGNANKEFENCLKEQCAPFDEPDMPEIREGMTEEEIKHANNLLRRKNLQATAAFNCFNANIEKCEKRGTRNVVSTGAEESVEKLRTRFSSVNEE